VPFDDLDTLQRRSSRIQRVPQPSAPPPVLPFDHLPSAEESDIQRAAESDGGEQGAATSEPPSPRLDVFQALVAAGMVPRPSSMPAPPSVQRSPAREAYLAQRAQETERRPDSPLSAPFEVAQPPESIQRIVSEDSVETSPQDTSEPQIDVDHLARDVMQVLREKIRSERERRGKF
jgi:hypothetical protein